MPVLFKLLKLVAPNWKSMALATFFSFLTIASNIGLLAVSALLIARAALHPPILYLMPLIVGVRFFGISRAVFRYLERYISHKTTFGILKEIRVWFYSCLEPLAPAALSGYRRGELLSNLVNNVETLKHFYLRVLAPPATALVILMVTSAFLARFEIKLALTFFFFYVLAGIGTPILIKILISGVGQQLVKVTTALNAHLVDCIQGMTELTVFGHKERYEQETRKLGKKLVGLQGHEAGLTGLANTLTGLLANLTLWTLLVLAIPLVEKGELEGIYLAMLVLAAYSGFEAIYPLPLITKNLEESLAAGKNLIQITAIQPQVQENLAYPTCQLQEASLRIEGLSFRYDENEPWVLQNINLELLPGERLAIIGPSGAGKSTLINLLLRFWEYEKGKIYLGGYDLKSLPPELVRSYFSVVSQQTHLFNATVKENLLLAKPTATPEEIIAACQKAHLHDFIETLPRGYETYIGEKGLKLSGGQRQRLAIARALLKDAPFLILDEATNGLDAVTERELWQELAKITEGKTTLIITHRLTGLEKVDKILRLNEKGQIKENGPLSY